LNHFRMIQLLSILHTLTPWQKLSQAPGDLSRVSLLKHWKTFFPGTPLPLIQETQSVKALVETVKLGDGVGMRSLEGAKGILNKLMELVAACQQEAKAKTVLEIDGSTDDIIGRTPVMKDVFDLIARSSQAFSTVLILGESGTGKDLVAHAIHRNSPRQAGPFLAINCAAMPDTLVESELFGYEKGAFTGAVSAKVGQFEAASGGTLFIDEIGDCALSIQAKLLRILENRIVTPVGGHREIKVDTRVVVATSRDLPAMVAKGTFREDLYYRLNIITISLPPLRDRVMDIPLLVRAFIERVNKLNHSSINAISASALEALQHYRWPGNVRQLLNVIERAMVLSDTGKTVITLADLPAEITTESQSVTPMPPASMPAGAGGPKEAVVPKDPSVHDLNRRSSDRPGQLLTLNELEQQAIQVALAQNENNKTKAAHAIGISVRTLQRKLALRETPEVVLFRNKSEM
ncbi:MAG: sigma-54 interaction domain-containing protein, partial [Phycisphaerae bacterium]